MTTMKDMLDVRAKAGEIGIEVELEGKGLPGRELKYWRIEHDGSLRGEAVEIVLKNPVKRQFLNDRLNEFSKSIKNAVIHDSGRAGIHIHVNIQELTPKELAQFMCLYLVFENTLVEWCGAGRVGNLFCLRCEDAPALLEILRFAFRAEDWNALHTDELRYASMNAKAVATYGSLEFRAMRSTVDTDTIKQWIAMLLRLKDKAKHFASPMEVVERLSHVGTEGFFDDVLGGFPGLKFRNSDIMGGVRNAQHLAYCRMDWEQLEAKTGDREVLDVIPNAEEEGRRFRMDGAEANRVLGRQIDARGVPPVPAPAGMVAPEWAKIRARKKEAAVVMPEPDEAKGIRLHRPEGVYYKAVGKDGMRTWLNVRMIKDYCELLVGGNEKVHLVPLMSSFFSLHWTSIMTGRHNNLELPMDLLRSVHPLLENGEL